MALQNLATFSQKTLAFTEYTTIARVECRNITGRTGQAGLSFAQNKLAFLYVMQSEAPKAKALQPERYDKRNGYFLCSKDSSGNKKREEGGHSIMHVHAKILFV